MPHAPDDEDSAEPSDHSSKPTGTAARVEAGFERILALSRIVILAPVIVLVLSGFGAFAYGTDVFISSVPSVIEKPIPVGNKVGYFLVEVDLFLIGATLIIAAFGFYELFISRIDPGPASTKLPAWLQMRDLNDLKARVISMLILVAAVTFLDVALDFHEVLGTLYLGAAVALVIGALTAFLRLGSTGHGG